MPTQNWPLTLAYWLHMSATVIWIGGLATLAWIAPLARRFSLSGSVQPWVEKARDRLLSLGWLCLTALAATGLFQLSANPHYSGFLAIDNRWALAILIKHGLIVVMVAIMAYLTWWLYPAMRRVGLRLAKGLNPAEMVQETYRKLQRQERWAQNVTLVLAIFVLVLTAIARAA